MQSTEAAQPLLRRELVDALASLQGAGEIEARGSKIDVTDTVREALDAEDERTDERLELLRSLLWELLHAPGERRADGESEIRDAFSVTSAALAYFRCRAHLQSDGDDDDEGSLSAFVGRAARPIDEALIVGRPRYSALLQKLLQLVERVGEVDVSSPLAGKPLVECGEAHADALLAAATPDFLKGRSTTAVQRLHRPSLAHFTAALLRPRVPAVLTGVLDDWPALQHWNRATLWTRRHAHRTVPVELGADYRDERWRPELMPLRQFVERYILGQGGEAAQHCCAGYLAQHQLLEQIPSLKSDIIELEYTSLTDGDDDDETLAELPPPPTVNVWLGPANTVTPLHHDNSHNLLAQVFGCKLVIMFPPSTGEMYEHASRALRNTSCADVAARDAPQRFPALAWRHARVAELRAGELLFIPRGWWHHVRSVNVSCSVSFWFGAR